MVRSYEASPWTAEDRALMLAWAQYQATLCPGCGQPKSRAWWTPADPKNGGEWETTDPVFCDPCTVQAKHHNPEAQPTQYVGLLDVRPYEPDPT